MPFSQAAPAWRWPPPPAGPAPFLSVTAEPDAGLLLSPWPWLGLLVLVAASVVLFWPQLLQAWCLARVRKLARRDPARAERPAAFVCRLLERLAVRRRLNARGTAALAQSHVLL